MKKRNQKARFPLCVILGACLILISRMALSSTSDKTIDPNFGEDWNQASQKGNTILGENPIAFLAKMKVGYALGEKSGIEIEWVFGMNSAAVKTNIAGKERLRIFHISIAQMAVIDKKLNDSHLLTEVRDMPSRTLIPPDTDYWILFAPIGNKPVILRSDHPGAIESISKALKINKRQAIKELGPDFSAMVESWSSIEAAFQVVHP